MMVSPNDCRAWDLAAQRINSRLLGVSGGDASGAVGDGSGAAAGFIPFKTNRKTPDFVPDFILAANELRSRQTEISFSEELAALRRVKRLKKSVWASGHLHGLCDAGFRPPVVWFVTLTYKGVDDWKADHMSKAIQGFRDWCKLRGYPCRYTWVAELQGRGAVHYHLLAWLPRGAKMPKWDRRTCTPTGKKKTAWWPHGMTNVQVAKAGVGYLMKYLSKLGALTKFPKGLRLYGVGGLNSTGRAVRSWLNLPEWVKAAHGVGEVVRKKIGFVLRLTGEVLEPAYSVKVVPGGLVITQIREIAKRFHDGAYSTFPRATV